MPFLIFNVYLCSSRLTFPDPPSSGISLLKMGSKFRYSDRTLHQLRKEGFSIKNQPKFQRVSSRNWSQRYHVAPTTEHRIFVDEDEEARQRGQADVPDINKKGRSPYRISGQVTKVLNICHFNLFKLC